VILDKADATGNAEIGLALTSLISLISPIRSEGSKTKLELF
jgi:hypothetical protein